VQQITLLKNELDSFRDDLTQKVSWVICNKIDLIQKEQLRSIKEQIEKDLKIKSKEIFFISAATGEGTKDLLKKLETEVVNTENELT
jgi:GTP-binding protein